MISSLKKWWSQRRSAAIALLSAWVGLWLAASPVFGRGDDTEPTNRIPEASTWLEWLMGTVFLIGCLVIAFKNSKRSSMQ